MPTVIDDLVCNPVQFAPELAELSLSGPGLQVVEADFGEAVIEAAMIRRALGEEPADRHWPNKEMTFKLRLSSEGEVDLATVVHQLEATVSMWQRPEGGWLERVPKVGGNFGAVACQVKKAALSNISGWQKGDSPDVTLTLITGPFWYSTIEVESSVFTETEARELVFELAEVLGTAPGLIRIQITNDNESADWRGLILAAESRDHPQDETADTTAALAYDAVDLTLKGGAVEKEREGVKVVRHESLSNLWQAILGSEITGVGHQTHKGVRRLWIRVYDPGETAGEVQLRLEWRSLGSSTWTQNVIVPTPVVSGWALVDMGECRLEQAVLGDERWEWKVMARTTGLAGADIDIHLVWPLPNEQMLVVRQPWDFPMPDEFSFQDAFNQATGNLTGKADETGKTYVALSGSDAEPDFVVESGIVKRSSTSDTGTLL